MSTNTWVPPEEPSPSEILESAIADTGNGEYATSLAKFLWFHHNALRYEYALYSVRLWVALCYWQRLARLYPPAETTFTGARENAEQAFLQQPSDEKLFLEAAAFNRAAGNDSRTASLFESVARSNPALVTYVYFKAEPFLVSAGRYELCGPFLQPEKQLFGVTESYRGMMELDEGCATLHFMHHVGTLIALLVLNGRTEEANSIRKSSLSVIDDEQCRSELNAAMTGHLPSASKKP